MAKLPLSQTVDASQSQRSWRSSVISLLTSTAVQLLTIAVLVAAPLLVAQTLPEPMSQLRLPTFVSVQIQPPIARAPEPPAETSPTHERTDRPMIDIDSFVPPPVIPGGIPDDRSYFALGDPTGVAGGLPPSLGGPPLPPSRPAETAVENDTAPIRIIGDIRPPRKVLHVDPVYPPMARAARIQGTVVLQAVIDINGNVSNLNVIGSVTLLDRAAIEAVRQWRYEPTLLSGRAVAVLMTVEVTFQLR